MIQEENFYHRHLLDDQYVCVMRKSHLLAGRRLGVNDYVKASHSVVTYGGTWRSGYLRALDERGLSLNQVVTVPSISDLRHILLGTDLVSTVPRIGLLPRAIGLQFANLARELLVEDH
ncbi:LysR substrate-binding domain-containing protein [Bradyrhizobium sp. AS23.2]|uniref:LysR substrate-binding domain-containing protein n=1 Tax=Bradyrhizobium sp. AS23.2 TaxID=1680155 RepID=UPI00093EA75E|nr:LysR substrate-binding domain-containing protein [Bradyrhizobium sp. AS23.2]